MGRRRQTEGRGKNEKREGGREMSGAKGGIMNKSTAGERENESQGSRIEEWRERKEE